MTELHPGWFALSSGGLWLPEAKALVLADVHLGFGWAQRRRGELGPLFDDLVRAKLLSTICPLAPERIVLLGDAVHAPQSSEPERLWLESVLKDLATRARVIAVRGNHDRLFSREFAHLPLEFVPAWEWGPFRGIHGDRLDAMLPAEKVLLIGHLHPALGIRDGSGASHRLPAFVHNRYCVILPAFSPFAAGFNLWADLPEELRPFFGEETIEVTAITGQRVAKLGSLAEALRRIGTEPLNDAGRFRRSSHFTAQ